MAIDSAAVSGWFTTLDVDDNGHVSLDDFEVAAYRLMKGYEESPLTAKGAELLRAFTALWRSLAAAADTDDDGKVTASEMAAAIGALRSGAGSDFTSAVDDLADAVLGIVDTDASGVVEAEEFRRMLGFFGVARPAAEAAFGALDADGSGALTAGELRRAFRDFYLGSAAPDVLLFG